MEFVATGNFTLKPTATLRRHGSKGCRRERRSEISRALQRDYWKCFDNKAKVEFEGARLDTMHIEPQVQVAAYVFRTGPVCLGAATTLFSVAFTHSGR